MSITDELREYAHDCCARIDDDIHAIADRIDAEHESACAEAYGNGVMSVPIALDESAWVKLPVDADGEHIHVGDELTDDAEFKSEGVVECLMLDESGWMVEFGKGWTDTRIHEWHHHHAPTVEDVLRDMHVKLDEVIALYVGEVIDSDERDRDEARIFAEYAAKLRLAEEEDA